MYGCYVFESRHGATRTRCSIYLLGSPALNGLVRLHKLSFKADPKCSGTLVDTRLPIGGTTLGRRRLISATVISSTVRHTELPPTQFKNF